MVTKYLNSKIKIFARFARVLFKIYRRFLKAQNYDTVGTVHCIVSVLHIHYLVNTRNEYELTLKKCTFRLGA